MSHPHVWNEVNWIMNSPCVYDFKYFHDFALCTDNFLHKFRFHRTGLEEIWYGLEQVWNGEDRGLERDQQICSNPSTGTGSIDCYKYMIVTNLWLVYHVQTKKRQGISLSDQSAASYFSPLVRVRITGHHPGARELACAWLPSHLLPHLRVVWRNWAPQPPRGSTCTWTC